LNLAQKDARSCFHCPLSSVELRSFCEYFEFSKNFAMLKIVIIGCCCGILHIRLFFFFSKRGFWPTNCGYTWDARSELNFEGRVGKGSKLFMEVLRVSIVLVFYKNHWQL
jgi:hypothetical protein